MELNKKQTTLLYLDTNGFYYYDPRLPNIVSMAFDPKAVRDMDVVDSIALESQIKSFFEQYKLEPSIAQIILSPHITFEKDFVKFKPEEKEEIVKKFIDTIPFDNVMTREYPIEQGIRIIGANSDMYQELKKSFEKNASTIQLVVPYQALGPDQALIQNLIPENAAELLKKSERLRQLHIATEIKPKIVPSMQSEQQTKIISGKVPANKTRLYVMAGVFAFLFAILGYMIITMKP